MGGVRALRPTWNRASWESWGWFLTTTLTKGLRTFTTIRSEHGFAGMGWDEFPFINPWVYVPHVPFISMKFTWPLLFHHFHIPYIPPFVSPTAAFVRCSGSLLFLVFGSVLSGMAPWLMLGAILGEMMIGLALQLCQVIRPPVKPKRGDRCLTEGVVGHLRWLMLMLGWSICWFTKIKSCLNDLILQ